MAMIWLSTRLSGGAVALGKLDRLVQRPHPFAEAAGRGQGGRQMGVGPGGDTAHHMRRSFGLHCLCACRHAAAKQGDGLAGIAGPQCCATRGGAGEQPRLGRGGAFGLAPYRVEIGQSGPLLAGHVEIAEAIQEPHHLLGAKRAGGRLVQRLGHLRRSRSRGLGYRLAEGEKQFSPVPRAPVIQAIRERHRMFKMVLGQAGVAGGGQAKAKAPMGGEGLGRVSRRLGQFGDTGIVRPSQSLQRRQGTLAKGLGCVRLKAGEGGLAGGGLDEKPRARDSGGGAQDAGGDQRRDGLGKPVRRPAQYHRQLVAVYRRAQDGRCFRDFPGRSQPRQPCGMDRGKRPVRPAGQGIRPVMGHQVGKSLERHRQPFGELRDAMDQDRVQRQLRQPCRCQVLARIRWQRVQNDGGQSLAAKPGERRLAVAGRDQQKWPVAIGVEQGQREVPGVVVGAVGPLDHEDDRRAPQGGIQQRAQGAKGGMGARVVERLVAGGVAVAQFGEGCAPHHRHLVRQPRWRGVRPDQGRRCQPRQQRRQRTLRRGIITCPYHAVGCVVIGSAESGRQPVMH